MRDYYMPETPITDAVVVTNADSIRAMSDEELATWMAECNAYGERADASQWLPWLKQPAEEEAQPDCTYNKNGHCIGQKLMPECDAKNCDRRK